jgi:hypothetical protein
MHQHQFLDAGALRLRPGLRFQRLSMRRTWTPRRNGTLPERTINLIWRGESHQKSLANEFYAGPIALGGFLFFVERARNNGAKRPIKPRGMHSGTKQAR